MKEKNIKRLIRILIQLPIVIFGAGFIIYLIITEYGGYGIVAPIPSTKLFLTNTVLPICIGTIITALINATLGEISDFLTDKISFFLFRKNETKIIEKGRKNWVDWYVGHSNELSDTAQAKLVELAKNSEKHRDILLNYKYPLCDKAAKNFVEDDNLFELLKEYLNRSYYQRDIVSNLIKRSVNDKKYEELAHDYLEKEGYSWLSNQDTEFLIEKDGIELLTEFCKHIECFNEDNEIQLVLKAEKDERFKNALHTYLTAIKNGTHRYRRDKNCLYGYPKEGPFQNNISKEAEKELVKNGSYETIELYWASTKNLRNESQTLLAQRYLKEQSNRELKEILLQQEQYCEESQILIAKEFQEQQDQELKKILLQQNYLCKDAVNVLLGESTSEK